MKKILFVSIFTFCFGICFSQRERVHIENGCLVTRFYASATSRFMAYGNVYVETDPKEPVDLCVKVVDSPKGATFKVYKTTDTPQSCGEWRFVNDRSKAKFTIRYVKQYEDCTVFFVNDRSRAG